MVADSLAGERLIVVVLLRPGWEDTYYGNAPVHDTATLGTIEEHEPLPDGRSNILLNGLERVRLVEGPADATALPGKKLYRISWIASAPETVPQSGSPAEAESRMRLRSLWQTLIDESGIHNADPSGVALDTPFAELVNQIAMLSGLSAETKQFLLEQDDLTVRSRELESSLLEQIHYWRALNKFRRIAPEDPRVN
jgi:Lon protease-like protein